MQSFEAPKKFFAELPDDQSGQARTCTTYLYVAPYFCLVQYMLKCGLLLQDGSFGKPQRIVDREDQYRQRRLNRIISPPRNDAYAMGDKTPGADVMTYADIMKSQQLQRDTDNTLKNIADKQKAAAELMEDASARPTKASGLAPPVIPLAAARPDKAARKRNRWDQSEDDGTA